MTSDAKTPALFTRGLGLLEKVRNDFIQLLCGFAGPAMACDLEHRIVHIAGRRGFEIRDDRGDLEGVPQRIRVLSDLNHLATRSHDQQHIAFPKFVEVLPHFPVSRSILVEKHHAGLDALPGIARGLLLTLQLGAAARRVIPGFVPDIPLVTAGNALHLEKRAVNVVDVLAASPLQQIVNVLRDHGRTIPLLPGCDHLMGRIRLRLGQLHPALIEEPVNEVEILLKEQNVRNLVHIVVFPQTVLVTESREPGIRTDSGSGKDDEFLFIIHDLNHFQSNLLQTSTIFTATGW